MTLLRATLDVIAELWFALDTASALRRGKPIPERARAYCVNNTASDQQRTAALTVSLRP